jgi:hypothetical protein
MCRAHNKNFRQTELLEYIFIQMLNKRDEHVDGLSQKKKAYARGCKTMLRFRRRPAEISILIHRHTQTHKADGELQSLSDGIEKIDGMPLDPYGSQVR